METKTVPIPMEDLFPILQSIDTLKMRVYASLLYWLAARAGELLPYQHYKTVYKRDEKGNLIRDHKGFCEIESRTELYSSLGVPVSTIRVEEDIIFFDSIPVFKSKKKGLTKAGIVPRKKNPLFEDITSFVSQRKQLQEKANTEAENSGKPPATIYLFEKELESESNEQFFWRFKKRLDRLLSKKGYSSHSFRKTRLTRAGNVSGDVFYVKALSGHSGINMASEYVAKKNLFDNMKRYEGL